MTEAMSTLLVIEDDELFGRALRTGLQSLGYRVETATDGPGGLEVLERILPNAILLDLVLAGDMYGLEVLERIRARHPFMPVIIMTGYGTIESAVAAMKRGASDYIQKPMNIEEIGLVLRRNLEMVRLHREVGYLRSVQRDASGMRPLVAASPSMRRVLEVARRVANKDGDTVLIEGPSGSGKDAVARLIHDESQRRHRPYVVFDCAALSAGLEAAELFGSEPGAVEGAALGRPGRFEIADGGTLLLDEIGRLNLDDQAKLLRVLEDRRLYRLGSDRQIPVDVRVIATSSKDLEHAVEAGEFRRDLYFRLNIVRLELLPLRCRREDIMPLATAFLRHFTDGRPAGFVSFSPQARHWLLSHRWPGNVRELRNLIERIVLVEEGGGAIEPSHLAPVAGQGAPDAWEALLDGADGADDSVFDRVQRRLLAEALRRCRGNQSEAARWLGLSRARLGYRLRQYGIEPMDFQDG